MDLQRFESLVTDFGIEYTKEFNEEKVVIHLKEGAEKVGGYGGFVSNFYFNSAGDFIEVRLYE